MSDSEELWQEYSSNGEPTGRALTKAEARSGILHGVAHVWIWRAGSAGPEVFLQVRAKDKATWPDYLDISAAGHIDFGEAPLATALRETREEVGLALNADQLRLLFVYHSYMVDAGSGIIEDEFQWVYGYEVTGDIDMTFTDGEVDGVQWLTLQAFQSLIAGQESERPLVPHGDIYFTNLLAEITPLTK